MKIPETIKVGGLTFKVIIVDDLEDDKSSARTNYQTLTIKIEKAKEEFMKLAFLHEMFHTMNSEFDEEKVESLAVSLFQIITDNPKIFNGE